MNLTILVAGPKLIDLRPFDVVHVIEQSGAVFLAGLSQERDGQFIIAWCPSREVADKTMQSLLFAIAKGCTVYNLLESTMIPSTEQLAAVRLPDRTEEPPAQESKSLVGQKPFAVRFLRHDTGDTQLERMIGMRIARVQTVGPSGPSQVLGVYLES